MKSRHSRKKIVDTVELKVIHILLVEYHFFVRFALRCYLKNSFSLA